MTFEDTLYLPLPDRVVAASDELIGLMEVEFGEIHQRNHTGEGENGTWKNFLF
jgi:hypothetical protein